jgi:hypothetical protein
MSDISCYLKKNHEVLELDAKIAEKERLYPYKSPLQRLDQVLYESKLPEYPSIILRATCHMNNSCLAQLLAEPTVLGLDFPAAIVPLEYFSNMAHKVILRIGGVVNANPGQIAPQDFQTIFSKVDVLLVMKEISLDAFGNSIPARTDVLKHVCVVMTGQNPEDDVRTLFENTPKLVSLVVSFLATVNLTVFVAPAPRSLKALFIQTPVTDDPGERNLKIGSVTTLGLKQVADPFQGHYLGQTTNVFEELYLHNSTGIAAAPFCRTLERSSRKLEVLDLRTTNLLTDNILNAITGNNCCFIRILRADHFMDQPVGAAAASNIPGFSLEALKTYLEAKVSQFLEILTLCGNGQITNDIFIIKFSSIAVMRKLDLRHTSVQSDDQIVSIELLKSPAAAGAESGVRKRLARMSVSKDQPDPLLIYINGQTVRQASSSAQAGASASNSDNEVVKVIWNSNENIIPDRQVKNKIGVTAQVAANCRRLSFTQHVPPPPLPATPDLRRSSRFKFLGRFRRAFSEADNLAGSSTGSAQASRGLGRKQSGPSASAASRQRRLSRQNAIRRSRSSVTAGRLTAASKALELQAASGAAASTAGPSSAAASGSTARISRATQTEPYEEEDDVEDLEDLEDEEDEEEEAEEERLEDEDMGVLPGDVFL